MHGVRNGVCEYLENACNSVLSEDVSSFTQQLLILMSLVPMGIIVVFPLPTSFVYNTENYYKLYDIISIALWPDYTCPRPNTMRIATLDERSLSTARGFFFPIKKGHANRWKGTIDQIVKSSDLTQGIPLMNGLIIPSKINSIIISGNSGSGKSLGVQAISELLRRTPNTKMIYIDPKKSAGARWARGHPEVTLVIPEENERLEEYLIRVTQVLAKEVNKIFKVQNNLFHQSSKIDSNAGDIRQIKTWLVVEELEALEAFGTKKELEALFHQLLLISLLGREAYTNLMLSMQVPRNDILPVPIRSQMRCRIQLGRIDSSTTTYLFPDLDHIMMPYNGPGIGICDIDGMGVQPIAMPTITSN
ncbi:chromosome partitioning protein ParA [Lactobacillus gallinarum]|uniref:chromosome partitioning protein ParA n=1 Tax=Lactobacillus gallinarum TaxID=52242 RepID=UPI0024B0A52F|nr:chromosome partitioning protein ParA [Lactobacillus gallinarum]